MVTSMNSTSGRLDRRRTSSHLAQYKSSVHRIIGHQCPIISCHTRSPTFEYLYTSICLYTATIFNSLIYSDRSSALQAPKPLELLPQNLKSRGEFSKNLFPEQVVITEFWLHLSEGIRCNQPVCWNRSFAKDSIELEILRSRFWNYFHLLNTYHVKRSSLVFTPVIFW